MRVPSVNLGDYERVEEVVVWQTLHEARNDWKVRATAPVMRAEASIARLQDSAQSTATVDRTARPGWALTSLQPLSVKTGES